MPRVSPDSEVTIPGPSHSPYLWGHRKLLVEAFLAQQPVSVHLTLALELGEAAVLQVVPPDVPQHRPRLFAHVDTPSGTWEGGRRSWR